MGQIVIKYYTYKKISNPPLLRVTRTIKTVIREICIILVEQQMPNNHILYLRNRLGLFLKLNYRILITENLSQLGV